MSTDNPKPRSCETDGAGFDEESIELRDPSGYVVVAIYLNRSSARPDMVDQMHRRADLTFVNTGLSTVVSTLTPANLRQLARFLRDYSRRLEEP